MSRAPFAKGTAVRVPGRYKGLRVVECWRERAGWRVRAEFESGFGWYEGRAEEFERVSPFKVRPMHHPDCDCSGCLPWTY